MSAEEEYKYTYLVETKVEWGENPPPMGAKESVQSTTATILEDIGVDVTSISVLWGEQEREPGEITMDGKLFSDTEFKKIEHVQEYGTVTIKIHITPF